MKRIFTTCLLLIGLSAFAQDGKRSAELLKNEASTTEMKTIRKEMSETSSSTNVAETSGFRTQNQNQEVQSRTQATTPSERRGNGSNTTTARGGGQVQNQNNTSINRGNNTYSYRYDNAELYLRVLDGGFYTVQLGNQRISNSSGKFGFVDVGSGRNTLAIYRNGYLVYRINVTMKKNYRMVLDFSQDSGLYMLDHYYVRNQNYAYNNWNSMWNNVYSIYGTPNYGFYGNQSYGYVMDNMEFNDFASAVRNNSFDSNKLSLIKQQLKSTMFTAQQIRTLMNMIDFDSNRLQLGKMMYTNCVDRNNFYKVYETFDFDSNRRNLMSYVANV